MLSFNKLIGPVFAEASASFFTAQAMWRSLHGLKEFFNMQCSGILQKNHLKQKSNADRYELEFSWKGFLVHAVSYKDMHVRNALAKQ